MPIIAGLQGVPQTYAWGVKGAASLVAKTAKQTDSFFSADEATPYAELWFGAHPSGPSAALLHDGSKVPVLDWLRNQRLPYLFKVLSIALPLSLQLHPDEETAARLHREDPEHYKDPHSKPEAAIALSDPAEAFCGFRKLREILMLANSVPAFGKIVGTEQNEDTLEEAHVLKEMMTNLYALSAGQVQELVDQTLAINPEVAQPVKKEPTVFGSALRTLKSMFRDDLTPAELLKQSLTLFRRLHEVFPYDRGVFAAFFLNYVRMKPGDVIVLAPNTIHAYIAGNMLEVMKTSDNVIRAGLTPKFQDVDRLLQLVNYKSLSIGHSLIKPQDVLSRFEGSGKVSLKAYIPQITDSFRFYTIHLSPGAFLKDARIPDWCPMMVFVLRGSCEIIGTQLVTDSDPIEEHLQLKAGQASLLEQGLALGVRNLSPKSAKKSSTSSPFLLEDFEAASNEAECDVIVVVSNLDPSRLKRSAKQSMKSALVGEPMSTSPSPPSVAEFPVVTPLEQAAFDEPTTSNLRDSSAQSVPFLDTEAQVDSAQAEPAQAEPAQAPQTPPAQTKGEAHVEAQAEPTVSSPSVELPVTVSSPDCAAKEVSLKSTERVESNDGAVAETCDSQRVTEKTTEYKGATSGEDAVVETPTVTVTEPMDDSTDECQSEMTKSPSVRSPPPRKPAATANEIAEVKIARTLAKTKPSDVSCEE